MTNADPFTRLSEVLERNEYLADLFLILHFDESTQPTGEEPVLHVPASIDQLFIHGSNEAQEFLAALILLVREDTRTLNAQELNTLVARMRSNYLSFREGELVRPIADEADPEIFELVQQLIPEPTGESIMGRMTVRGNLLNRLARTVRQSVTTTLSVSKRTGMGILMRGRDFSRLVRDRVTQLELPAKADVLVEKKTKLTSRLYSFKGGRATKFFVGLGLSGAGFVSANPVIGVSGLVLAIVDP